MRNPETLSDRYIEVTLCKWFDPVHGLPTTGKAKLFGYLQQSANEVVHQYHSDLYHDAMWIDRNVNEPISFYYAADSHGTNIGTDDLVLDNRTDLQLMVNVVNVKDVWTAVIADVKGIR